MCSADDLPFGDATFDSISVRFGYMFFPDVAKATAEFARAQVGRTSLLVGMGQARGKPVDDDRHAGNREGGGAGASRPGRAEHVSVRCPGICDCPVRGKAGLRDVVEWDVDVELVTRSPAEYWEMISEHVSLAVAALQQVDEPARERIAKAVIAKGQHLRRRRQGKDSGRGPLHRRHEVGTLEQKPASARQGPFR